jgi:hypothetical protein
MFGGDGSAIACSSPTGFTQPELRRNAYRKYGLKLGDTGFEPVTSTV